MRLPLPSSHRHRSASLGVRCTLFLCLAALPQAAQADHCRWRFYEGFQRFSKQQLSALSPDQIAQQIEETFGPRQTVCEETAYRYFVAEFSTYAAAAFHHKGAERDAMLVGAQEILKRIPSQVFFKNTKAKTQSYQQLRSDLGAVAREVGITPPIQGLLDAVDRLGPPAVSAQPEPMSSDPAQIQVPTVPLPPWAVISLYEIRDHAQRKEDAAILTKTTLILNWIKRITPTSK